VLSAKARANAGLDFDLFTDPAEDPSTSEQVSTTNNLPQATTTEPIKSRKAKGKGKEKNISIISNTNEEVSEDPKEPPKLYSILSQTKSARELRKDPATALFPLVAKRTLHGTILPWRAPQAIIHTLTVPSPPHPWNQKRN
jgi:hypothetical protein